MYRIYTIKDVIKVPPTRLGSDLKKAIKESIGEKFEGLVDERIGIGLAVVSVDEVGEGKIRPADPSVYYPVTFKLLAFKPEMHEVVLGEVIDNTEFGSFIRFGPLDGLVHISQLMDDFVSYDEKNSLYMGRETRRTLKEGDVVRARIISVSLARGKESKIGLTMRQPFLGALTWIEEEKKKQKKAKSGG